MLVITLICNLGMSTSVLVDKMAAYTKEQGIETDIEARAFQRVEGVVTALWTFADLTMGGVLVFALRAMTAELLPPKALPWISWTAVVLGTAGALVLFPAAGTAELWNRRLVPAGNLALGVLLPALLWVGERLFRRKGKNSISCMRKPA